MGCVAGEGLLLESVLLLMTSGGLGFVGFLSLRGSPEAKKVESGFPDIWVTF